MGDVVAYMSFIISLINAEIMQVLCFGLTLLTIGIQVKTKQMLKDASKTFNTTSKCHDRLTDISHNVAKNIIYASFCKISLILVKIGRKKELKI